MKNLGDIREETIEKCKNEFVNYKGFKKYRWIYFFFNFLITLPIIVIYSNYKYKSFNSFGYDKKYFWLVFIILVTMILVILKIVGGKKYKERTQSITDQYMDLKECSVLDNEQHYILLKDGIKIRKVKKSKIIDVISVDNAKLVIYDEVIGMLNFIIV